MKGIPGDDALRRHPHRDALRPKAGSGAMVRASRRSTSERENVRKGEQLQNFVISEPVNTGEFID